MLSIAESLLHYPPSVRDIYANGFSYQNEPILLTEFGGGGFDVSGEQEINGMLTYQREPKCSLEKIRQINEMYHPDRIH